MTEENVLADHEVNFDGPSKADIEFFLFFFENVAEKNATGNYKARATIKYLDKPVFQFYYREFTAR